MCDEKTHNSADPEFVWKRPVHGLIRILRGIADGGRLPKLPERNQYGNGKNAVNSGTKPRKLKQAIGGRYRIRTYDFHRVKMALYR